MDLPFWVVIVSGCFVIVTLVLYLVLLVGWLVGLYCFWVGICSVGLNGLLTLFKWGLYSLVM